MKREEKNQIIEQLVEQINSFNHFYLTDISDLNAEETSDLRRTCFKNDVQLVVVKNTLLRTALEQVEGDHKPLYDTLKGSTSIMFTNTGNAPAKLIKELRKTQEKPIIKGAFVEQSFYIGDENLDALVSIKSKEEVIADIIALLQSPVKNVISALQSSGDTIHGLLQTLSEKE